MGHYDTQRDEADERIEREYRQREMADVCRRLASAMKVGVGPTCTVGEMLKLKNAARQLAAELNSAAQAGDIVFAALLNAGEIIVSKSTQE